MSWIIQIRNISSLKDLENEAGIHMCPRCDVIQRWVYSGLAGYEMWLYWAQPGKYPGISRVFSSLFHPVYYLRASFLSLLVVAQIRGHIAGSSLHCGWCHAFFIARRLQHFLPSSTRIELRLPTQGALSS